MGYSICISPRSPQARDAMLRFLEHEFKPLDELCAEHTSFSPEIVRDGEMGYDHGKCRIGFNYSCGDDSTHEYIWTMLRWMALKVGRKKTYRNGSLVLTAPYIRYDGNESIPVVTERPAGWPRGELTVCDRLGMGKERDFEQERERSILSKITDAAYEVFYRGELARRERIRMAIGAEMMRLDALWGRVFHGPAT